MAETAIAPAPAPAPSPQPKPSSNPAPPQRPGASRPAENLNDAFSQLEGLATDEPQDDNVPIQQRQQRQSKSEPKPQDDEPEPRQQQTPPKAEAKPEVKTEEGFPDGEKATKMRAGELSRHYKTLKSSYDELQKKVVELSSRPVDNEKLAKLETEAKENHSRWEKAQEELRFTKYERSQEYQDKYWKPYEKAYNDGANRVAGLTVVPRTDPDTGEVTQAARQATREDFNALMVETDDNKAAEMAEALFGVKAPMVLMHRDKALEANSTRLDALKEFREKGAEIEKARAENLNKGQEEISKLFKSEAENAVKKYPHWFAPIEGDEKGNELLQKGFDLVEKAYNGQFTDENGKVVKLSPVDVAKLHSVVRNRAVAFGRLTYQNKTMKAEIEDLKTKIAGYSESEPGGNATRRPAKTSSGSTMDDVLASLGS